VTKKIFLEKTANLLMENKLLKLCVIVIGLLQVVNLTWNYSIMKSSRTVVVPAGFNEKMEMSDKIISESGIKQYVRYVLGLALNYNPATARIQFDELLTICAPDSFSKAKSDYYSLADDIEKAKVSSSFFIQKITFDQSASVVEVQGMKKQYTNEIKVKDDKPETYIIEYMVNSGKFLVVKIYLKEKS